MLNSEEVKASMWTDERRAAQAERARAQSQRLESLRARVEQLREAQAAEAEQAATGKAAEEAEQAQAATKIAAVHRGKAERARLLRHGGALQQAERGDGEDGSGQDVHGWVSVRVDPQQGAFAETGQIKKVC